MLVCHQAPSAHMQIGMDPAVFVILISLPVADAHCFGWCVQFSHYFWPSVFGIIPGILLYVYLGTLAVDITQVISDKGMSSAPATGMLGLAACQMMLLSANSCARGQPCAAAASQALDSLRRLCCICVAVQLTAPDSCTSFTHICVLIAYQCVVYRAQLQCPAETVYVCCTAAKVVFIVLSAATALLAIVLSAVYTKRAIDRRLAHVQMSEHADAEQQPCPCEGQHPATAYEDHPVLIIEDDVQRQRQHHMQYNAKAKAQSAEAYRQAHHALRTEDQGTKQESRLSGRSHDDTAWLNCVASYCCILSVLCCISSAVAAAGIYQQSCTVRDMQSDKRLFLLNRPIKPVLE